MEETLHPFTVLLCSNGGLLALMHNVSIEVPDEDLKEFLPLPRMAALKWHKNQDPRKWISEIEQILETLPQAGNESAPTDDTKLATSEDSKQLTNLEALETKPQPVEHESSLDNVKTDPETPKGGLPSKELAHTHEIGEVPIKPYQMDDIDETLAAQHASQ